MKRSILLSLIIAVFMASAVLAAPRANGYPKTLISNTAPTSVTWDVNDGSPYPATHTAKIVYGVSPLNYYGSIDQTAPGTAVFTPNAAGMTGGVYYCRISDTASNELSYEFKLYIKGSTSVQMSSPANNTALDNLSPQFQWNPVAGTPFYTILVFDTKATIDFSAGSLSVTANVIWGATTDQTYITYGTPDPSGYFDKLSPPPLMQGLTYSWLVLNNYDGTPSMIADNFAGVRAFTVNPAAACSAAVLTAPGLNVTITAQPITLTWTAGAGANNYKAVVMKNLLGTAEGAFGSATVPLWSGYTTGTEITIPQNIAMNDGWYQWYVVALDSAGRGIKSSVREFRYDPTPDDTEVTIQINENTVNPSGVTTVPNVVVFMETTSGGNVNVYPMVSSESGGFYLDMQPAEYTFILKKSGFMNTIYTRTISGFSWSDTFIMARCAYAIRGVVKDNLGSTVSGARVKASQAGDTYEVDTIADGSFVVYIPASGSWGINITKTGYQPKNTAAVVPPGGLDLNEYTMSTPGSPTVIIKNVNTLTGRVTNDIGQGIFDAQVVVSESGNPSNSYPANTNSSGDYVVSLPDGVWVVNVTKPGFVPPPSAGLSISGGAAAVRDFTMQPQANTISGNVKDDSNNAMQGVTVRAVKAGFSPVETGTDISGNYTLSVGTGTYLVNAVSSGWEYNAPSQEITVTFASPGMTPSLNNDFVLQAAALPANASALVSVKTGTTPIAGADVTLSGNEPATMGFLGTGITDAQGSVTITALAGGQYALTVVKTGYDTFTNNTINLVNAVVTLVNAGMTANATTGTLSGTTSSGASTVQIFDQANPGVQIGSNITTAANGTYSVPLTAGNYIVKAFKSGYSASPAQQYSTVPAGGSVTADFTMTAASGGGIIITAPSMPIYNEGIGGPYQFSAAYVDGLGNNVYAVFSWAVVPADAGTISSTGVLTPTSDFIGPITVSAAALGTTGYAALPVYQKMNPSYGAVTVRDYAGMTVAIPAGAASASNSIDRFTMTKAVVNRARSNTPTKRVVGKVYDFTTGFTFNTNIILTLPIEAGQGVGTEKVGLWNDSTNTWDVVGGTVSGSNVASPINHFSSYTVLAALGTIGLAFNENTPNPFSPDKGPIAIKYVTDSKVASSVRTTIKVFNMAGKHIRTILDGGLRPVGELNTDTWDGRDERGRVCLNGRYMLQIEVEDSTGKKQKIYSIALVK